MAWLKDPLSLGSNQTIPASLSLSFSTCIAISLSFPTLFLLQPLSLQVPSPFLSSFLSVSLSFSFHYHSQPFLFSRPFILLPYSRLSQSFAKLFGLLSDLSFINGSFFCWNIEHLPSPSQTSFTISWLSHSSLLFLFSLTFLLLLIYVHSGVDAIKR